MSQVVLALNAGSSTLKYTLYRFEGELEVELASGSFQNATLEGRSALEATLSKLREAGHPAPTRIGHRVVHGGARFSAPVAVDSAIFAELEALIELAPLHMPPALALLQQALARCPEALQVACFDTAFHHDLPDVARHFALPAALYAEGFRRYGFHGLSCQYISSLLGRTRPRLIVAHLGSGASLTAIYEGRSVDTSMGMTPAGGVPMGTRSGDLDPGVLVKLLRRPGFDVERLEQLVNHQSGLLGLSGSSDVAQLLARAAQGDAEARSGIELFAYAIKKQLGAYVAALGGLDCLVFTGGIGEKAPRVRELCCSHLEALGIELDPALNAQNAPTISPSGARSEVRVIATNEQLVIARAARDLECILL